MSPDTVSAVVEMFHCDSYKIDMPMDRQRGFCAIQFRKGRERCIDCEQGINAAKEERVMAEKKLCSKGCGKGAIKDDLCYKHYREKHGVPPYTTDQEKVKNTVPAKVGRQAEKSSKGDCSRSTARHEHACEDCQAEKVMRVMVAAGIVPEEKVAQARKLVQDLGI